MAYWYKIHRWISFICMIFFLMFCITALPLIFKSEIASFNTKTVQYHNASTYDIMWKNAIHSQQLIEEYTNNTPIRSISVNPNQSRILYTLNNNVINGVEGHYSKDKKQIAYFIDDGSILNWPNSDNNKYPIITKFMYFMHLWHASLGFGMIGLVFLGIMCLLCLISIVSGIALYAPFMCRTSFARIDTHHTVAKWFSWHKLLGILTSVWAFILCLSGTLMVILLIFYGMYISSAQKEAKTQLVTTENIQNIQPKEVIDFVNTKNNDKVILAIDMPNLAKQELYYKIQLTSPESLLPIAEQYAFVGIDGQNNLTYFTKEQPIFLKYSGFITDLHVNNHNTIILKIIWGILDILTIIVIISGLIAWWRKKYPQVTQIKSNRKIFSKQTKKQIWFVPGIIIILSLLGMVLPLYELNRISEILWIIVFIICIYKYIKNK